MCKSIRCNSRQPCNLGIYGHERVQFHTCQVSHRYTAATSRVVRVHASFHHLTAHSASIGPMVVLSIGCPLCCPIGTRTYVTSQLLLQATNAKLLVINLLLSIDGHRTGRTRNMRYITCMSSMALMYVWNAVHSIYV